VTFRHCVAALIAGLAVASCAVEVELAGKSCPCTSEYECDPLTQRCVINACAVSAKDFRVLWSTPTTMALAWTSTGDLEALLRYQVIVAESEEDLASRSGTAVVISDDTNPELAVFGGFEDAGELDTPNTSLTEDEGRSVLQMILSEIACTAGHATCGEPLKVGIDVAVGTSGQDNGVKNTEMAMSYLEVVFQYTAYAPATEVPPADFGKLFLTPADSGEANYYLAGFTVAPGPDYQTLVIPLDAMIASPGLPTEGQPLSHADLLAHHISQFGFSAQWHRNGVVRIDSVKVLH
jgi:hypothetical protein